MRGYLLSIFVFLLLLTACSTFRNRPPESIMVVPPMIAVEEGAIQNAGCGTEIWSGGAMDGVTNLVRYAVRVSPYSANAMIRVGWDAYESGLGDYHFEKMDTFFEQCLKYGQKLNVACFVTSNAGTKQTIDDAFCCYPDYVHAAMQKGGQKDQISELWLNKTKHWEPNFENPYLFERYDALLAAFAAYLEKPVSVDGKTVLRKKLVRCIEMRHFGYWGEGAYPKKLIPSNSDCLIRFADAYVRHFPDIRLVVPTNGMGYSPLVYDALVDYHFHLMTLRNNVGLMGILRDNWGCNEDAGYYQKIYHAGNLFEKNGVKLYELIRDRWQFAPLVGEPGRWGPKDEFHPYWGVYEQTAYLRPVTIRNCNVSTGRHSTNPTDYSILKDEKALEAFQRMYSVIGFRYVVTEVRITRQDGIMSVATDWLNIGYTPTYDLWKIRYFMMDAVGKEIWSGFSALDLRTVFPDQEMQPGVADVTKARRQLDVFEDAPKTGELFMQIVDPDGISPCLNLSIRGRNSQGAYFLTELSEKGGDK